MSGMTVRRENNVASQRAPHSVGDVLEGRYEIDEVYGSSGACWYYRACYLPAPVVSYTLKQLDPDLCDDPQAREAFDGELRSSERAACPPFIRNQLLLISGDGDRYLVREQLVTGSLGSAMQHGRGLSVVEATRVLSGIAFGCVSAHNDGRALGCVSPRDVLMPIEGRLTANNVRLLQPGYPYGAYALEVVHRDAYRDAFVAPEVKLSGQPTVAGDIYGLGALLAYLLVGSHFESVAKAHEELETQGEHQHALAVIERACRLQPEERYASVDDLLVALQHCASQSIRRGDLSKGGTPTDFVADGKSSVEALLNDEQVIYASRDDEHELTPPNGSTVAVDAVADSTSAPETGPEGGPDSGTQAAGEDDQHEVRIRTHAAPSSVPRSDRRGFAPWADERSDEALEPRLTPWFVRVLRSLERVVASIPRYASAYLAAILVAALIVLFFLSTNNQSGQDELHNLQDNDEAFSAAQRGMR